jgi:hypothetical protein
METEPATPVLLTTVVIDVGLVYTDRFASQNGILGRLGEVG